MCMHPKEEVFYKDVKPDFFVTLFVETFVKETFANFAIGPFEIHHSQK